MQFHQQNGVAYFKILWKWNPISFDNLVAAWSSSSRFRWKLELVIQTDNRKRLFRLFLSLQPNITILQQIYVKNNHPVFGAGIWTHSLQNMSLLS